MYRYYTTAIILTALVAEGLASFGLGGKRFSQNLCSTTTPCQNDGTCVDKYNGYMCLCEPGWTGDDCETDVDECASNPCQNGGTCVDNENGYVCTCVLGWTGTSCESRAPEFPIFRASAGSGAYSVYYVWASDQVFNEADTSLLTEDFSVKGIYKSSLIDTDWRFKEVKVKLYTGGSQVWSMTFNATEEDKMTWFRKDNILDSPYTDLATESTNFFSIEGDVGRRFFIQRNYGGCAVDLGWFMVLDRADDYQAPCSFDLLETNWNSFRPRFFYNSGTNAVNNGQFVEAEVMIIFARYPDP